MIRSFPLHGANTLHPAQMISITRPPVAATAKKKKEKKKGVYPGCLAHVVNGMSYSIVANRRQRNPYIIYILRSMVRGEGIRVQYQPDNEGRVVRDSILGTNYTGSKRGQNPIPSRIPDTIQGYYCQAL